MIYVADAQDLCKGVGAMWDCQVVILGSEEYDVLADAGWEPFHFALVPEPTKLMAPNTGGLNFAIFVGMRIQLDAAEGSQGLGRAVMRKAKANRAKGMSKSAAMKAAWKQVQDTASN
jgi:hypothetical protein